MVGLKRANCLVYVVFISIRLKKPVFYLTLGKELTMWDDDPDIMDAYEEYDYECESDDGLDDLAFDSVVAADLEDDALDKEGDFFDDED